MSQRLNRLFTGRYAELARTAALLEQSGQWAAAAASWEHAADAARLPENLLWAKSRTRYCNREAELVNRAGGRLMSSDDLKSLACVSVLPKNARSTLLHDDK